MATPSALLTASPSINDPLGNGYANITELAEAIASRLDREHTITRNGASVDHEGLSKAGSALAFFSETQPASRLDGVAFADEDRGLLWVKPMPSLAEMTYVDFYVLTEVTDGVGTFTLVSSFTSVKTDSIVERTADAGVTIEGMNVEDDATNGTVVSGVDKLAVVTEATIGGSNGSVIGPIRGKFTAINLRQTTASGKVAGDLWMV